MDDMACDPICAASLAWSSIYSLYWVRGCLWLPFPAIPLALLLFPLLNSTASNPFGFSSANITIKLILKSNMFLALSSKPPPDVIAWPVPVATKKAIYPLHFCSGLGVIIYNLFFFVHTFS